MTPAERAEWSGNPITAGDFGYTGAVNLVPPVNTNPLLTFRDGSIDAKSLGEIVIGDAADFAGNTVTLSAEYISPDGELALWWSDGTSASGAVLNQAGSMTRTLSASSGTQLVLHVAKGYYGKVMLEMGRVAHAYVPYSEVIPTEATKGAYNYSDLNRVERAVAEIAEILGVSIQTKTNWSAWDIPSPSDLTRYLRNVRTIQSLCGETTVIPESLEKLTYATANEIEAVLLRCRSIAEGTLRCGELICGEV